MLFASRADAQRATVPPDVPVIQVASAGRVYSYARSPSGTAIETLGDTWAPAEPADFGHWGFYEPGAHDVNPAMTGTIRLTGMITVSQTVILRSRCIVLGDNEHLCGFRAAPGMNADLVRTEGFDLLTGTGKYLLTEGVPYGFGLRHLTLDGNKAENETGRGLVVFGKGYFLNGVIIKNTAGGGWYSECGMPKAFTAAEDIPEGDIGPVTMTRCGFRGNGTGYGLVYKGPADARISSVVVAECDGNGMEFITDYATFNGKCDLGFAHVYAAWNKGVVWQAGGTATHIIGESCDEEGILVQGWDAQIGKTEAYRNCIRAATHGRDFGVYVDGGGHSLGQIEVRDGARGVNGVNITASRITADIYSDGGGSPGVGVTNTGTLNRLSGRVKRYCVALDLSGRDNTYGFTVDDCGAAVNVGTASDGVRARITASLSGGQVLTGAEPISAAALNKATSEWDIAARVGTEYVLTRQRIKSAGHFNAAAPSGTFSTIIVPHKCPFIPDPEDISIGVVFDNGAGGAASGAPAATVTIAGITDTAVIVRYHIIRPGAVGTRGFVTAQIHYA